jgi:lysophospholipase L1-like esterase
MGVGLGWMLSQGCGGHMRMPGSLQGLGSDVPDERKTPLVAEAPPAEVAPAPQAPPVTPAWVRELQLTVGPGSSDEPCAGVVDLQPPVPDRGAWAPPIPALPEGVLETEPSPFDLAGMLPWQVEGANEALPAELRAALQLGAPFDVSRVPLEPLQGSPAARARLRRAMERAADPSRLTRFAAWGASHVAGEFFTGEVRRLLQTRWGDGGHGVLMPAPPWNGYRRNDVNLCSTGTWGTDFVSRAGGYGDGRLGFTGIRVEPKDASAASWVSTTRTNPHGRAASRVYVYWLQQPEGRPFQIAVDGGAPAQVATAGPVGPGALLARVPDGPHRVEVRGTDGGGPPPALLGISLERESGFVLDSMGVSGRTASSWLGWDEDLVRGYLGWRPPELFVLAYGTNEANDDRMTRERYRALLRAALQRARAAMPEAACVLVGPSDRGKELRGGNGVIWGPTAMVAQVQREVAPEFDCLSWDLQRATGGPGSMFRWREANLAAPDLIHFTAEGYREIARRFVQALDAAAKPEAGG